MAVFSSIFEVGKHFLVPAICSLLPWLSISWDGCTEGVLQTREAGLQTRKAGLQIREAAFRPKFLSTILRY